MSVVDGSAVDDCQRVADGSSSGDRLTWEVAQRVAYSLRSWLSNDTGYRRRASTVEATVASSGRAHFVEKDSRPATAAPGPRAAAGCFPRGTRHAL